jgi:hypothetical protein
MADRRQRAHDPVEIIGLAEPFVGVAHGPIDQDGLRQGWVASTILQVAEELSVLD